MLALDRALANQSATGAVDGGKSKIVRKTPVAEKTVPASVPVPTTEHIQVPLGLSTFVTLPLFATVMQKVKEQSNATSVSVSCDEKSSKISITITASTVEAKTLARKLVEEELSKSLVIQTSKNKLQKQKKTSDEDDASDSPDPIPVPSPVKTKTLPPTKVKPTLPEKSKPVEVLPVVKDRAIDEVSVRQSAVSSSSVTQLKASDKGKGKTDGLSALLQAMKQLPDSEVNTLITAIYIVFSTLSYHLKPLKYGVY